MFLAMNRFRIALGRDEEFIQVWRNRNSYLDGVPGFVEFHLMRSESTAEFTLFASHSVWESREAFVNWTHSEAFRKAHASAGQSSRDLYLGPPQLELFDEVM